jgi:DNA repair protein RadD
VVITLRPDQIAVKNQVYNDWNDGARVVLAVMPTGTGKSIVMTDINLDLERLGARQVITAHRQELVSQMAMHVARRGIYHRVIAPTNVVRQITADQRQEFGRSFVNPDARCAVAGIDTLNSRAEVLKPWAQNIDYWFGDEGHHYLRLNKWGKGIALFGNARGLLVTACPERADGMGLGSHADGLADRMIVGLTFRQSIEAGAITDYELIVPASDFEIDDSEVAASGDFGTAKMKAASKRSHIVGDVVTEYVKAAWGKRAICFATDVETAGDIAARFNASGIPAVSVSAKTPDNIRSEMIRRFKEGKIWVLVNVDLFDEGFDVPACEVVIMARPTASLNKYLQMIGRALRTAPGKVFGLIIDHVSNWKRHGLPDKPRSWTLDRREKRGKKEIDPDDIPLTVCRQCTRPYERFHALCPYCGFEPPLPDPADRSIKQVDGDLTYLTMEMLAAMRADMTLESPASVAERVAAVAGKFAGQGALNKQLEKHAAQQRLFDAIAQWAGIKRAQGEPDSALYRRFYLVTGMDVLSALHKDRTRQDYESLAEIVEGWCNV